MIFRGRYFKDDLIIRTRIEREDRSDNVFHIEMREGSSGQFSPTTPEERKAFVEELERRMAYKELPHA